MSESNTKQILVLAVVFVLSQILNKRQTEKVLRKIRLDMPEKTKYKIRDGLYFNFCATGGSMSK